MTTIFTQIITGQLPGRFVWRDERCVAFLSNRPLKPGHTLVVPIVETDHWVELDDDLLGHLAKIAKTIGKAIDQSFSPVKVGMMIVGLEVPHVHIHVVPIDGIHDMEPAHQDFNPDPGALDEAAVKIRSALRDMGEHNVHE